MISLGMNQFINAQGFGRMGMLTVLIGAVTNIVLDPVFIFVCWAWGCRGRPWPPSSPSSSRRCGRCRFLRGKKALIRLRVGLHAACSPKLVWQIVSLGFSSFVMAITNCHCAGGLQLHPAEPSAGDLYVGVMTIINSVREVVSTPINGAHQRRPAGDGL